MRTKEFRRWKRNLKIKQRQETALDIGHLESPCYATRSKHFSKLKDAACGDRPGLFAKHDYGMLTDGKSMKTNVRKRQSSYRHKGGYGKAMVYTVHDQRELDKCLE